MVQNRSSPATLLLALALTIICPRLAGYHLPKIGRPDEMTECALISLDISFTVSTHTVSELFAVQAGRKYLKLPTVAERTTAPKASIILTAATADFEEQRHIADVERAGGLPCKSTSRYRLRRGHRLQTTHWTYPMRP